jgi:uncharacterized integral membrane protein
MNFIKSIFRIFRSIVFILALVSIVIFMVNNRDMITIHLHPLPFEIETRTFLIIIISFVLGIVFGLLTYSQNLIKSAFTSFKSSRRIKKLEKQIIKNK